MLLLPRVPVQSLVRELRSHKPRSAAKKKRYSQSYNLGKKTGSVLSSPQTTCEMASSFRKWVPRRERDGYLSSSCCLKSLETGIRGVGKALTRISDTGCGPVACWGICLLGVAAGEGVYFEMCAPLMRSVSEGILLCSGLQFIYLFIYLFILFYFIYGCVGSSFLCEGFL